MYNFILCIAANIFRIYIIRQFMGVFYDTKREQKGKEFFCYTVYFLYTIIPYLLFHQPVINFVTNFSGMLALTFLYSKSVKKNIFVASSIYIVNIVCDCIVILLFVDYKAGNQFNEIFAVLTDLLFWICYFGVGKVLQGKEKSESIHIPVILIPVGSVGIVVLLVSETIDASIKIVFISVVLLLMNIWSFHIYGIISGFYKERYEGILLKREVEAYQKQRNMLEETELRISHIRHDLRHHICELKILAGNKKYEEIIEYLDNMEEVTEYGGDNTISGNQEIDSMINFLMDKAEKNLKVVKKRIRVPSGLQHAMDTNIILSNLLENAIEAAMQSKEQFLDVVVIYQQGVLKIAVTNSYEGDYRYEKGVKRTTKKEGDHHGIGLQSVERTVEKHDGEMMIETSEGRFCVKIIMYI